MAGPWDYVRALLADPAGPMIFILYVGLSVFCGRFWDRSSRMGLFMGNYPIPLSDSCISKNIANRRNCIPERNIKASSRT